MERLKLMLHVTSYAFLFQSFDKDGTFKTNITTISIYNKTNVFYVNVNSSNSVQFLQYFFLHLRQFSVSLLSIPSIIRQPRRKIHISALLARILKMALESKHRSLYETPRAQFATEMETDQWVPGRNKHWGKEEKTELH